MAFDRTNLVLELPPAALLGPSGSAVAMDSDYEEETQMITPRAAAAAGGNLKRPRFDSRGDERERGRERDRSKRPKLSRVDRAESTVL